MTIVLLLLVLWTGWLWILHLGNKRLRQHWGNLLSNSKPTSSIEATWIIPFRNESHNIQHLFLPLEPKRQANFLWINDGSTDSSLELLQQTSARLSHSDGKGKKAALMVGWEKSDPEWCFHSDADVKWSAEDMSYWLRILSAVDSSTVAVFGLPSIQGHAMDMEDYRAAMYTAAGMAGWGLPFLGSGAALAVRKNKLEPPHRRWLGPGSSGDDVFLLHAIEAEYGRESIKTLPYPNLSVIGAANLKSALAQRLRWAGKSIQYRQPSAIAVSVWIFGWHTTGLLLLAWPGSLWPKFLLILGKVALDALGSGGSKKAIKSRILLSLFYWIYIPLLPLISWLALPWREAKKVW